VISATRHRPDNEKRLSSCSDGFRQWRIWLLVRPVFFTCEKPHERPSLLRHVIADRTAQYRVRRLERVEHRTDGHPAMHIDTHLALDAGERSEVGGQFDSDQFSVCTSTDRTAGRSRTIAVQLSPPSGETYTWPPVVPKYTPQASSESTAIASLSTFT